MTYPITPLAGPQWNEVNPDQFASFALGTTFTGPDGRVYIFARASAPVAANTACVLTETPGVNFMTMAAGAGAWTSPPTALVANDRTWFRKNTI